MKLIALFVSFWMWQAVADENKAAEPAPASVPAAAPAAPAAAEKTFTGEAANIQKKMVELFDASRDVNGPKKEIARKRIELALDWDKVAKACLGPTEWAKRSAKDRTDFTSLLKEVMVRTAYTRMDSFWDKTTYRFETIDVKGNDAHVLSKFTASGEVVTLDYYLTKKGSDWLVYDISYEDNRYSSNINEQITAFLKEKPFGQLVTSLKKRRDDLVSGKVKKNKG